MFSDDKNTYFLARRNPYFGFKSFTGAAGDERVQHGAGEPVGKKGDLQHAHSARRGPNSGGDTNDRVDRNNRAGAYRRTIHEWRMPRMGECWITAH